MAKGDAADILTRLRGLLPPWFPDFGLSPVVDGVLIGTATTLSYIYSLYTYAVAQSRIATSTDAYLDLTAWDFFGARFGRNPGEGDASFVKRILAELIRPRVTRAAVQNAVEELTGYPVRVIEPWQLTDVGFWKVRGRGTTTPISFQRVDTIKNPARWSSRGQRCQFFVECTLPPQQPFGNNAMPAWSVRGNQSGIYTANWMRRGTVGALQWGSSWIVRVASAGASAAVFALLQSMRAAGITCWVKFVSVPTAVLWDQPGTTWDSGAKWDS